MRHEAGVDQIGGATDAGCCCWAAALSDETALEACLGLAGYALWISCATSFSCASLGVGEEQAENRHDATDLSENLTEHANLATQKPAAPVSKDAKPRKLTCTHAIMR